MADPSPDPPPNANPFGWVVHLVRDNRQNARPIWAWCRIGLVDPSYDLIRFTADDGATPMEPPPGDLHLGDVLVRLWC